MTFFIDLEYEIHSLDAHETNNIDWWANQVPEKGDLIRVYSHIFEHEVELTVLSRTWNMTRQTGGFSNGGHDVVVKAAGLA